jgi:hypothetical protein
MQISKSYKWQIRDFEMKTVWIQASHEELGLGNSYDPASARSNAAELSKEVEALLLIELVKNGKLHPNQISKELAPWLPQLNHDR